MPWGGPLGNSDRAPTRNLRETTAATYDKIDGQAPPERMREAFGAVDVVVPMVEHLM